jgi:transposase
VVCLDNLNVHLDAQVRSALEERGCLIRFLPPYSLDFNPIELTFSMLKVRLRLLIYFYYYLYTGLDKTALSKLSTFISRRFWRFSTVRSCSFWL